MLGRRTASIWPWMAALLFGSWQAFCLYEAFARNPISCDNSMHLAAIAAGRDGLAQGTAWPYVHNLQMGWQGFGLYCWPLFVLMSALSGLLHGWGISHSDQLVMIGCYLLTVLTLPLVSTWTGSVIAQSTQGNEAELTSAPPGANPGETGAWGGLLGSVIFLCFPMDMHLGIGLATYHIGLFGQTVAWTILLACVGCWLRMVQASGRQDTLIWVLAFSLSSSALFLVHNLTVLSGVLLFATAAIAYWRLWRRMLLAAVCCVLLSAWYMLVFLDYGSIGMPSITEPQVVTLWARLFHNVHMAFGQGAFLASLIMVCTLAVVSAWLGFAGRFKTLRPLWAGCLVTLLASELAFIHDLFLAQIHWYRMGPHMLLLMCCGGGALLTTWLMQQRPSLSKREIWLCAVLGLLSLLVLPPWRMAAHTKYEPQDKQERLLAWEQAISSAKAQGLERLSTASRPGSYTNHDDAWFAQASDMDLVSGAQTTLCGPAFHWHNRLCTDLGMSRFCIDLKLLPTDMDDKQRLRALMDFGVHALLFDQRASRPQSAVQEQLPHTQHFGPGPQRKQVVLANLPEHMPIVQAIDNTLLCIDGPLDAAQRWSISAWDIDRRSAGTHADKRLIIRPADHEHAHLSIMNQSKRKLPVPATNSLRPNDYNMRTNATVLTINQALHKKLYRLLGRLLPADETSSTGAIAATRNGSSKQEQDLLSATSNQILNPARPQQHIALHTDVHGMELLGVTAGQAYLVRKTWTAHLTSSEGTVYEEASGMIVVIPDGHRMRIDFTPLDWRFHLLLTIAGISAVIALGTLVCCGLRQRGLTHRPSAAR